MSEETPAEAPAEEEVELTEGEQALQNLMRSNRERWERLQAQGKIDALLLLKLRVDLLTELLVPDSLAEKLNVTWEVRLSQYLDMLDAKSDLVIARGNV
jgi:hypothetical protein